jgi:hypothetical protein
MTKNNSISLNGVRVSLSSWSLNLINSVYAS